MVDVALGFGADGEAAEAAEPGVGAFDGPAVLSEGVFDVSDLLASAAAGAGVGGIGGRFAGPTAAADLGGDAALLELVA